MTKPGPSSDMWRLVCELCQEAGELLEFGRFTKLSVMQTHFDLQHPEHEGSMRFSLVWRGKGPAPEPPTGSVDNRAARRRRNKRKGR